MILHKVSDCTCKCTNSWRASSHGMLKQIQGAHHGSSVTSADAGSAWKHNFTQDRHNAFSLICQYEAAVVGKVEQTNYCTTPKYLCVWKIITPDNGRKIRVWCFSWGKSGANFRYNVQRYK